MIEAFLYPLLWVLGAGLGLVAVAFVAFVGYCALTFLARGDGEEGDK